MDLLKLLGLGGSGRSVQTNKTLDANLPIQDPNAPQPIFVNGDNFRPRKPSLLAILGDAMLVHGGYKPMFSQNRRNEDYRRAMEGFDEDPLRAIRRVSRLKGHEREAVNMFNQYQDNIRADEIARSNIEARKDRARDRLASMMGVLTPDNYDRMLPTLQRYAQARGLDPDEIPSVYDADAITAYRAGGLTVDQQSDNARADINTQSQINYRQGRLSQQGQDTTSRIQRRALMTAEQRRHNIALEGQAATNEFGRAARSKNNKPRRMKTVRGMGEVSPDGRLFKLDADQSIWRKNENNTWIRIK